MDTMTVYDRPASEDTIQKVAANLAANNIEALVVDDGAAAKQAILDRVPKGAQVHAGKSKTLTDIGVFEAMEKGDYQWLRSIYMKMDRQTQADEIRHLISAPDYMLNSAHAITEDGVILVASYSASQLGPIASGAGRVIFAIGSQKIVPDLAAAHRRIEEHVFPWEDASLRETMGVPTRIAKILQVNLEARPGRTTAILIREPVGV